MKFFNGLDVIYFMNDNVGRFETRIFPIALSDKKGGFIIVYAVAPIAGEHAERLLSNED